MKVIETELKKYILDSYSSEHGSIYLFKNLVITEINEGEHVTVGNNLEQIAMIARFYGKDKPFGYISNRINSFSVEAIEYSKFTSLLNNMKIFASVIYHKNNILSIEMEKKFCEIPYETYDNLLESYKKIDTLITNSMKVNI